MATKKSYSRYFIILQEQEKGYSLASDKLSSGYAKIEIKNDKSKVSFYVQNLKKESSPYHMILICNKKDVKRLINLGELSIDDNGRTEVAYEYAVEDVAQSGVGVDKVVGAAIVRLENSDIIPVMVGFITTETQNGWEKFEMFYNEESDNSKETEKVGESESTDKLVIEKEAEERCNSENLEGYKDSSVINEELTEVPVVKEMSNIDEIIQEDTDKDTLIQDVGEEKHNISDSVFSENIDSEKLDTDTTEVKDTRSEEQITSEEKSVFDVYEESIKNVEEEKENESNESNESNEYQEEQSLPRGSVGNYFKMVAEGLEELKDLSKDIKRCRWYKVPINDKKDFWDVSDYDKYNVIYYPMYNYYGYISKYNHFLIGYKYDAAGRMKYVVYGIPGKKSINEQPHKGETGFVTWIPLNEGDETEESLGYWLMFYNFRNRVIAIPSKV